MHTDTTFFTNEPGNTLLDRFKRSLAHFRTFDCLVGYFRLSGFHELYPSLENVHKIRILVGIDADGSSYRLVQLARGLRQYHCSYHDAAESAFEASKKELDSSEDSLRLETGIRKFIEFLVSDSPRKEEDLAAGNNGKKMEIRAYPHSPLHAKTLHRQVRRRRAGLRAGHHRLQQLLRERSLRQPRIQRRVERKQGRTLR